MEEPESDDDEQTSAAGADRPTISLSAIAGIRTEDTMQVYVMVGNVQCVALLDSGSTHTFISSSVA